MKLLGVNVPYLGLADLHSTDEPGGIFFLVVDHTDPRRARTYMTDGEGLTDMWAESLHPDRQDEGYGIVRVWAITSKGPRAATLLRLKSDPDEVKIQVWWWEHTTPEIKVRRSHTVQFKIKDM